MITHHYQELLNFCLRKTRNRDAVADLAQESCAHVLEMQQAGQIVRDPRALLRQVTLRLKIDMDRRAEIGTTTTSTPSSRAPSRYCRSNCSPRSAAQPARRSRHTYRRSRRCPTAWASRSA